MIDSVDAPSTGVARWALAALGLSVMTAAHFYMVGQPDLAMPPLRWLATLYDVAVWVGLLALALTLGQRVNHALRLAGLDGLEEVVYGLGSGLIMLSLALSALAFAGLVSAPLLFAGLAATGVWLRRDLLHLGSALAVWRPAGLGGPVAGNLSGYHGVVAACGLLGLLAALPLALAPPVNYDALMYHMTAPRLILESGRVAVIPALPQMNLPLGLDVLFVPCLALGSDVAAHLLAYSFAPLTALVVFVLARRLAGPSAGVLGASLFVLQPVVLPSAGWVASDLGLAFACALAMATLLRALEAPGRAAWPWLIVAGGAAGWALSIKYTALGIAALVVAGAGLAAAQGGWGRRNARQRVGGALMVGLVELAVGSPWYIKNGLALGNPFYPFDFSGLIAVVRQGVATRPVGGLGGAASLTSAPGHTLGQLIRLPWDLLVAQQNFTLLPPSLAFTASLLALPVVLWYGPAEARLLALATLGALLFWALGIWELRYAFPAFGPLSAVGGVALAPVLARRSWPIALMGRYAILGLYALSALAATAGLLNAHHLWPPDRKMPMAYLLGTQSWRGYVRANVDQYPVVAWMNAHLPPTARVAYLWDQRSYYSAARRIVFLPRDTGFPPIFTTAGQEQAWLSGFPADYLFVYRDMLRLYVRIFGDQPAVRRYFGAAFEPFRRRHLRQLYDDGPFQVYRIVNRPARGP